MQATNSLLGPQRNTAATGAPGRYEWLLYIAAAVVALLLPLGLVRVHSPLIRLMDEVYHPLVLIQLFVFSATLALTATLASYLWLHRQTSWAARLPFMLGVIIAFHYLTLMRHHAARSWDYLCYEEAAQAIVQGLNPYGSCYIYFPTPAQALAGVRVLDLTRILAGPTCTQLLGDLGADVIKIEMPNTGDDTRRWGPPFWTGAEGEPTKESAYFSCANRNKRSVTINISSPEGQKLIRELAQKADVLVENFKFGGLAKYGLGYDDLKEVNPGLVYCSITGFGHTGPYAPRPGYDVLMQAMGGLMSVTGAADGEPQKCGVPISDLMAAFI